MTAIGTCPKCGWSHAVDKKDRMLEHERANGWSSQFYVNGVARDAPLERPQGPRLERVESIESCNGVGKYSLEQAAIRRSKRSNAKQLLVDHVRPEALVALDAHYHGREDFVVQYGDFLRLALTDYKLRYPQARPRHAFVSVERGRPRSRGLYYIGCDIYCTFCRELLLANIQNASSLTSYEAGHQHTFGIVHPVVAKHCVPCLLTHLAGVAIPRAPDDRQLPAEARGEECVA